MFNNQSSLLLKEIQKKLQTQELSVLIGAGFSKNANESLFPSWWQLLKDMVLALQGVAIKEEYLASGTAKSEDQFIEDRIGMFIAQIGPLKIATLYMESMGYREAIDSYIEHHTPHIIVKESKRFLRYYADEKPFDLLLKESDLLIHYKLIGLAWNNIYTTNYDNLLESCVDQNIEEYLQKQKNEQEIKNKSLEEKQLISFQKKEKIEKAINEREEEKDIIKKQAESGKLLPSSLEETNPTTQTPQSELGAEDLSKEKWTISLRDREMRRIDEAISRIEREIKGCTTVITNSSQLALKKNRNIIKLHGSIRLSEEEEFGFDNDARKHYVITEEDFLTYPQKHEAFTQLMRISLLQESFCLIGFSGADPNFLAWIGWVRDILYRAKYDRPENKIYLIDLTDKKPEFNKIAFYRNHRIAYLPLLSSECIQYLEDEMSKKVIDKQSKKEVLALFLDFLSTSESTSLAKAAVEVSMRTQYENLCEQLPTYRMPGEKKSDIEDVGELLKLFTGILPFNLLPRPDYPYDDQRCNFLMSIGNYLNCISSDSEALATIHHLIKAQYYPHSILFDEIDNAFSRLLIIAERTSALLHGKFLLLDLYDAIWSDDDKRVSALLKKIQQLEISELNNEMCYMQVVACAFRFEFSKTKKLLEEWDPEGYWRILKAGFLSLFYEIDAVSILDNSQKNLQHRLYELEQFSRVRHDLFVANSKYKNEIQRLKVHGLLSMQNIAESLTKDISKESTDLTPYGQNIFTISQTTTFSSINPYRQSLQLFGILIQSGFQLAYPKVQFLSTESIYSAAKRAFSLYPVPVAFYSLQYSDEKFIKRLAQDYAYSDELNSSDRVNLCKSLTNGFFETDCPKQFQKSILLFLSEFINVVEPEIWELFLKKYWLYKLERKELFIESAKNEFINKALGLVQDSQLLVLMISGCLEALRNSSEDKSDSVIRSLYAIANNPVLNRDSHKIKHFLHKPLATVIPLIPSNHSIVFALGNLDVLLDEMHIKAIRQILAAFDYNTIKRVRIWRIIIYYLGTQEPAISDFKNSVINSKDLWNAGFSDRGLSSRSEHIVLSTLKQMGQTKQITWTREQAIRIYVRLVQTLEKILDWRKKKRRRETDYLFAPVLQEMSYFLRNEQNSLCDISNFEKTLRKVRQLSDLIRGFSTGLEGIISLDSNDVLNGLDELMEALYRTKDFESYSMHLSAILNKLLLQSGPGLEECLRYISMLAYNFQDVPYIKTLAPILLEVLKSYRNRLPEGGDKSYIFEQLVRIAFVLKKWRISNLTTRYYLKMLQTSRFNNIRYSLRHQLKSS